MAPKGFSTTSVDGEPEVLKSPCCHGLEAAMLGKAGGRLLTRFAGALRDLGRVPASGSCHRPCSSIGEAVRSMLPWEASLRPRCRMREAMAAIASIWRDLFLECLMSGLVVSEVLSLDVLDPFFRLRQQSNSSTQMAATPTTDPTTPPATAATERPDLVSWWEPSDPSLE